MDQNKTPYTKKDARRDAYSSIEPTFRKQTCGFVSAMTGILAWWLFESRLTKTQLVILFLCVTSLMYFLLNRHLWRR